MIDITQYIQMLLSAVLALTIITNIIVQVLKTLLGQAVPANLLAFIVAVVVTVAAGYAAWNYYKFALTGWMIAALVAVCFFVAFAAMFGYDKFMEMIDQFRRNGGGENE